MKHIVTLTHDDATRAIEACRNTAGDLKVSVTIAVVDSAGALLGLSRMDGARGYTVDLAVRKARTAVAIGIDTALLQKAAGSTPLSSELLAVAGGIPVLRDGWPAGAIGISGAQPDVDGTLAATGLGALELSRVEPRTRT